jgi:DHA1 family tetracycline resistance protein-like MFS transporter
VSFPNKERIQAEMTAVITTEENETRPGHIRQFFVSLWKAQGALSTVAISICLAFAFGCTVAIVPEILSDRYARLYHGYDGDLPCSSYDSLTMPLPCRQGADNAQEASAWSSLLENLFTLFCSAAIGRLSDLYGRRRIFTTCIFFYTLAPSVLVWMQLFPSTDPVFYYFAISTIGVVSFMSIAFAALSDCMPENFRAASFGVVMAGFHAGFALSPSLALLLNHLQVSLISLTFTSAAFVYTLMAFPETLPEAVRQHNRQRVSTERDSNNGDARGCCSLRQVGQTLSRPFREMTILTRDRTIRLVAVGSFFSSMVFSIDKNLAIFYIEQHLNVREHDIAFQFLVMGVVGVIIQGFLLQPMVQCFGEKGLLLIAFLSGTLNNFLYGVAKNKETLYAALCLLQLAKTDTPILASLASKDVSVNEQGQLQGALYAVNALSAAIGPLSMQFVYKRTKDSLGPGTMFVVASFLFFVGTIVVSFIPVKNTRAESAIHDAVDAGDLEDTLLQETQAKTREEGLIPNASLDKGDLEEPLLQEAPEESTL